MKQSRQAKKALQDQINKTKPEDEQYVKGKFLQKEKGIKHRSPFIIRMLKQLHLFYRMLFDSSYSFSAKTRIIFIATLTYFIIPLDLLSDYIPLLGYIDDAMITRLAWSTISAEIKKYRQYIQESLQENVV